jgi:hypothetical protein
MGIITSTVRVGQKPPKEVITRVKKAVKEARKAPPVYDPDCPPLVSGGYTGIMADVLKYAVDNPGILTAATR